MRKDELTVRPFFRRRAICSNLAKGHRDSFALPRPRSAEHLTPRLSRCSALLSESLLERRDDCSSALILHLSSTSPSTSGKRAGLSFESRVKRVQRRPEGE